VATGSDREPPFGSADWRVMAPVLSADLGVLFARL
jgi:hypothetical protein